MSHGQKSDARNVKLISALILTVFRFFRKVEISHFFDAPESAVRPNVSYSLTALFYIYSFISFGFALIRI